MSLLLIARIERNPGPASQDSLSSNFGLTEDEKIIEDKFSIVHYNVQSIANKIDIIASELRNFDVLCKSETRLDARMSDNEIHLDNFKLFRRDRPGDHHGVICVYVRNNVFSKRRNDLELPNI